MIFVDTNYFVRYFLKDILSQFKAAEKLFSEGAKGKVRLFTSTLVIFEIYWVFGSFYGKAKREIITILQQTLALHFIELEERGIIEKAIALYEEAGLELEDCYNFIYAWERGTNAFRTFDKKIARHLKTLK